MEGEGRGVNGRGGNGRRWVGMEEEGIVGEVWEWKEKGGE